MRWCIVLGLALPAIAALGVACNECKLYCPHLLTVVFADAAGRPLVPESVTVPERSELGTFTCAADGGATCTGNRLTVDVRTELSGKLHAVATTGEVFDGSVTPTWQVSPVPNGACECHGEVATVDVTLTPP